MNTYFKNIHPSSSAIIVTEKYSSTATINIEITCYKCYKCDVPVCWRIENNKKPDKYSKFIIKDTKIIIEPIGFFCEMCDYIFCEKCYTGQKICQ
jgi:hypothetical protein